MAATKTRAIAAKPTQAASYLKLEKMKETISLISRVMQKCEKERRTCAVIKYDQPVDRAADYTGLHKNVIVKIADLLGAESQSVITVTMEDIDPMLIRNELMNFYLNEEILPTTKQLFDALQGKIPVSVDIGLLRKTLLKMNYMWKDCPTYNLVVIEKPTSVFERYHYLKRIIEYREEKRSIVFLDVSWLNSKGDFVMMTNPDDTDIGKEGNGYYLYGVSRYQIYGLTVKQASPFSTKVLEEWIRDIICFHVPPKSVIVLNNMRYNNEELKKLPTIDSFKTEMIEWLEYHKVPCSPSMCKTELFTLIEKFTNTVDKLYKLDRILKVYGHDVLRIPDSIINSTPTFLIRSLVTNNYRATPDEPIDVDQNWDKFKSVQGIFDGINDDLLKHFDDYVAREEKAIFDADILLDEKYDQLCEEMVTKVNGAHADDSDIPTLSDSD